MEMNTVGHSSENERDNVPFVSRPRKKITQYLVVALCIAILITQIVTMYSHFKLMQTIESKEKSGDQGALSGSSEEYWKFMSLQKKLNRIPMFCDFIVSKKDQSCRATVIIDCIEKVPDSMENVSSIMHLHIDTITEC